MATPPDAHYGMRPLRMPSALADPSLNERPINLGIRRLLTLVAHSIAVSADRGQIIRRVSPAVLARNQMLGCALKTHRLTPRNPEAGSEIGGINHPHRKAAVPAPMILAMSRAGAVLAKRG
jgi:hypothetical protein